ncbi:MAG: Histone H2A.2, partial [Cyphobasidiales sp. Tagirdzhanova-0007]
ELNKLLGHVVISQGGVLPNIHAELLPAKTSEGGPVGGGRGKSGGKAAPAEE